MDGVLADSEPVYEYAMNAVLAPQGKFVSLPLQKHLMGRSVEDTWRILSEELALEGPIDGLVAAYNTEIVRLLGELHEPLPGVRELIAELRAQRVPVAVASSSLPSWIEALLGGIDMQEAFDAVVSRTMVEHGKPAPDIYLFAAQRLGIAPQRCIGIEDTPTGLAAAKAAGMLAVQVRAASTAFEPLPEADIVLDTLRDFDLGWVEDAISKEQGVDTE